MSLMQSRFIAGLGRMNDQPLWCEYAQFVNAIGRPTGTETGGKDAAVTGTLEARLYR
jgi:hypothetical protein